MIEKWAYVLRFLRFRHVVIDNGCEASGGRHHYLEWRVFRSGARAATHTVAAGYYRRVQAVGLRRKVGVSIHERVDTK